MMFSAILCVFILIFYSKINAQLVNGDDCGDNQGLCIRLDNCKSALALFQNGQYPDTCGFEGNMPLVCCKSSEETVSEKYCQIYSKPNHLFNPAINIFAVVGGINSLPQEFPHMAALGYVNNDEIKWLCGGTLVSDRYILTAAHCLVSLQYGPVEWVRLGDIHLYSDTTSQDFKIKNRIRHPAYKSPSVYNDIALLELEKPVKFNSFIKPACLYTSKDIPIGTELTVTGWGLTKFLGNASETLQKADLDLFTKDECTSIYKNESVRKLKNGIDYTTQLCAGGKHSIKDSCQGDSGGPLQTYRQQDRIFSVVGITSFGKVCGTVNVPGVYTRVSYYVPWLEKIIWPDN